ncbi:hypothetical protein CVT25_014019 [Psilocybe cyanescens]|uniref:Cytochrome P450 n=1 Tax=Psilocybe cyanescens TaxID=93625 RepID=A0A409XPK7_PSICY|nr:hypothetical protein CVT25_014019 [Psilocybe cyanescens]
MSTNLTQTSSFLFRFSYWHLILVITALNRVGRPHKKHQPITFPILDCIFFKHINPAFDEVCRPTSIPILTMVSSATLYSLCTLAVCIYLWQRRPRTSRLPPGPKGYPLFGNVWDIPHDHSWLTYAKWAKKYNSDVIHLNVFGAETIVLNSLKAATELLDKRSSNYSDRPRMIMANELMGWEWDFAHMPYTDRWRRHRRSFHQYFQPRNLSAYYPVQRKVTVTFLEQILQTPEHFSAHIRQHVGSIVLRAAYGYEVKTEDDFYIDLAHKAMQPLLLVVHAGANMVDFIPALKHIPAWFPGATFKKNAEIWARDTLKLRDIPFENLKKAIAEGTAEQSYACDNLEKLTVDGVIDPAEEEIIRNCAGIMYLAGSDTSASLVHSWLLAMAHYPEIQRKAQEEIDSIVENSRLPDFNDRSSLPYVEATLLETLRWAPITPLALPHRVMQEDEYEGYTIPAGATVTPNVWAILHCEEYYPEPFKFNPDRFVKGVNKGGLQPDPISTGAFGFGRRTCPGRYLALNSAWIAVASILSTYNVSKAIDNEGNVIEPLIEYEDGLVRYAYYTISSPFKSAHLPQKPP